MTQNLFMTIPVSSIAIALAADKAQTAKKFVTTSRREKEIHMN